MKGLFIKEMYSAKVYLKNFLLLLAVILLISFFGNMGALYAPMMVMMFLFVCSIGLFSVDATSKWDQYAVALPVKRGSIVATRYLSLLAIMAGCMLLAFGLGTAISLFRGYEDWLIQNLSVCGIGALAFLLLNSVMLPVVYKLGPDKARIAIMVIYMVPAIGLLAFSRYIEPLAAFLSNLNIPLTLSLATAVILALNVFSYFISVRIYAKKEF